MPKVRACAMFAAGLGLASLILGGCGATSGSGGGGTGVASIGTATAMVNGQSVTILTDSSGKTLYYYQPDTATTSACTGSCASCAGYFLNRLIQRGG
jgi:predicted lipoprotein with Yx(FWY)xxD motif